MNVGTAYIELEARLGKLEKGLAKAMSSTKSAAKKAEGYWHGLGTRIGKSWGKMWDSIVKKAKWAALAIGATAVGFAVKSVKLAMEQETIEKRLLGTLQTRYRINNKMLPGILQWHRDYANVLQKQAMYSDEEILNAQRILYQYKVAPSIIKKATAATIEFANARDMSLESAAQALGTAWLSKSMPPRSGLREKNPSRLWDAILKQYSGGAQAARKANPLWGAKNAAGEWLEDIGTKTLPTLNETFARIEKIFSSDDAKQLADSIGNAMTKALEFVSKESTWNTMWEKAGDAAYLIGKMLEPLEWLYLGGKRIGEFYNLEDLFIKHQYESMFGEPLPAGLKGRTYTGFSLPGTPSEKADLQKRQAKATADLVKAMEYANAHGVPLIWR